MAGMSVRNLKQGILAKTLLDGTVIQVSSQFGQQTVDISLPKALPDFPTVKPVRVVEEEPQQEVRQLEPPVVSAPSPKPVADTEPVVVTHPQKAPDPDSVPIIEDDWEPPPYIKPILPREEEELEKSKPEEDEEDPQPLTFQLKFIRDDGLVYSPSSTHEGAPIGLGVTLYMDRTNAQGVVDKMPVFAGFTANVPGNSGLHYIEMMQGMVSGFTYSLKTGYYTIKFNEQKLASSVWKSMGVLFGRRDVETGNFDTSRTGFYIVTNGVNSLPTVVTQKLENEKWVQSRMCLPQPYKELEGKALDVSLQNQMFDVVGSTVGSGVLDEDSFFSFPNVNTNDAIWKVKSGKRDIYIPLFSVVNTNSKGTNSVILNTDVGASIPYQIKHTLGPHRTAARAWRFPELDIIWMPRDNPEYVAWSENVKSWAPGIVFNVGEYVRPSGGDISAHVFICVAAGKTSSEEPAWPLNDASDFEEMTYTSEDGVFRFIGKDTVVEDNATAPRWKDVGVHPGWVGVPLLEHIVWGKFYGETITDYPGYSRSGYSLAVWWDYNSPIEPTVENGWKEGMPGIPHLKTSNSYWPNEIYIKPQGDTLKTDLYIPIDCELLGMLINNSNITEGPNVRSTNMNYVKVKCFDVDLQVHVKQSALTMPIGKIRRNSWAEQIILNDTVVQSGLELLVDMLNGPTIVNSESATTVNLFSTFGGSVDIYSTLHDSQNTVISRDFHSDNSGTHSKFLISLS